MGEESSGRQTVSLIKLHYAAPPSHHTLIPMCQDTDS